MTKKKDLTGLRFGKVQVIMVSTLRIKTSRCTFGPMTNDSMSPAAQAVLDAFENASDGEYVEGVWVVNERTMLAAALRAAVDQLAYGHGSWAGTSAIIDEDKLLAIADELESQ